MSSGSLSKVSLSMCWRRSSLNVIASRLSSEKDSMSQSMVIYDSREGLCSFRGRERQSVWNGVGGGGKLCAGG